MMLFRDLVSISIGKGPSRLGPSSFLSFGGQWSVVFLSCLSTLPPSGQRGGAQKNWTASSQATDGAPR